MAGALISYRNFADGAGIGLNAGALVGGYPLANLQDRRLSKQARVANVSLQTMQLDLKLDLGASWVATAPTRPGLCALLGMNVNASPPFVASMTVSTSTTSGGVYTNIGTMPIGNDVGIPSLPQSFACEITGAIQRFVRVFASWPVAAGVTFGTVGRLWLGDAIKLPNGVDGDLVLDYTDPGRLDESAGFEAYEEKRVKRRMLVFNSTLVPALLAYGINEASPISADDVPSFQGLQLECGLTGELVAVARTSSMPWIRRTLIRGHVDSGNRMSIRKQQGDNYAISGTIIEER